PFSMVVVPRRRRLPGLDLLISRWRLLPQLRLILPVAVRPKRFFAPLFVFSLGISNPWFKVAAARHARGRPWLLNRGGAACRRLKARVIPAPPRECKAGAPRQHSAAASFFLIFRMLAEVGLRSGLVKGLRQIQSQDETPPAAATP